jgi:hypothetical protein
MFEIPEAYRYGRRGMTEAHGPEYDDALLVGVVTHAGSRQRKAGNDSAREICDHLRSSGIDSKLRINTFDQYSAECPDLTPTQIVRARRDLERVRRDWEYYIRADVSPLRRIVSTATVTLKSNLRMVLSGLRSGASSGQGPPLASDALRLLNIEASHLDLLRWQVAEEARWLLVLEDDAQPESVADTVAGIKGLIHDVEVSDERSPIFVDLSFSFTLEELGVSHLLLESEAVAWRGAVSRTIMAASRPVTNTVCAVLLNIDFSRCLLETIEEFPQGSAVPIDWKINQSLMTMYAEGAVGSDNCLHVVPGPLTQGSLHGSSVDRET